MIKTKFPYRQDVASPLEKVTPEPKASKPGDEASESALGSGVDEAAEEICKDLLGELDAAANDEG